MSAQSYVAAIKAMELRVLAEADLGYYQGDWVGLVKNEAYSGDKDYGFIVVGYGSCSGCDAWEAAEDPADRADLIAKILRDDAKWFSELDEAKAYIADHSSRELSFYAHEDGWPKFAAAVQKASEW